MTPDDSQDFAASLSSSHRQVWDKMKAHGLSAGWQADPERFVVTQGDQVLATHVKRDLPASMVVSAALFEAGHKLEAEAPGLKILPPMASA